MQKLFCDDPQNMANFFTIISTPLPLHRDSDIRQTTLEKYVVNPRPPLTAHAYANT